jgi:hypothetical protein
MAAHDIHNGVQPLVVAKDQIPHRQPQPSPKIDETMISSYFTRSMPANCGSGITTPGRAERRRAYSMRLTEYLPAPRFLQ